MKKFSWKISKILIWLVWITFLIFIWIFVVGIDSKQPGSFYNKGHNAVWIGHEWVGERKSDEEIRNLVSTLKENQIDTVFVHVGPVQDNGLIDGDTYDFALYFLEKVKKLDPEIEYQAWLGQIRYKLGLENEGIRHNLAKEAMALSQLVGFDGIHYDIEPVWDGDEQFIELLKETRELLPKDKKISVALAEFIPRTLIWMTEDVHQFRNYNSQINYKNVAQYADQVVVMAYDTGMKKPWMYRWLVKEQTIWLSRLLDGKELFVGIPAYEKGGQNFDAEVENVENGLLGIISGLNNLRSSEENFAGVAIYPYWEIGEEEWVVYRKLWLGK